MARLTTILVSALVTSCAWAPAMAQQVPLPLDMVASFPAAGAPQTVWAEELWLAVQPSAGFVKGRLTFDNSSAAGTVSIQWYYQETGAAGRTSTQSIELSMRPTAIARRAGTTDTFYIVGWSDRTGRVIVESCTFGQFALGSTTPQGGGPSISTFIQPAVTRVVEWVSDAGTIPPIWDAACQTYGDQLLMLANGAPTRIFGLDLNDLIVTELFSSTVYAELQGHRMISISLHSTGGFIALTERRRTWDHAMKYPDPDYYFIMRDADLDGTFEQIATEATDTFYTTYPPPWNNKYSEP